MNTSPAGWHSDPTGRFPQRYWDGTAWTDHVWASGTQSVDPLVPTPEPAPLPARLPDPPALQNSSGSQTSPTSTEPAGTTDVALSQPTRPSFPLGWSQKKREKKAAESFRFLVPGEKVLFQGQGGTWKPLSSDLVITDLRVFCYSATGIALSLDVTTIANVEEHRARGSMTLGSTEGNTATIGTIPAKDFPAVQAAIAEARTATPAPEARSALVAEQEASSEAYRVSQLNLRERWPDATVLGDVSRKSDEAIRRLCHADEAPWLVLAPGFAQGVLAAFEDRLAIIKTGAMTSFMAGSFGGERSTTFYYVDVNAIEYNSGLASGVLEILTASYQGTANKDYWRGTTRSRNADSNDPYTLSNTLPMVKGVYQQWAPQIQELRARIAAAKRPATVIAAPAPATPPSSGLVEQLERLATLRASGVLTEEEFTAAKARLVAG